MTRSTIATVLTLALFASRFEAREPTGNSPVTLGAALRSTGEVA